jgi:nucleoside-diphosphate kinase
MRERTLVLIKPDAVVNYHIGDIISRYEKEKFDIVANARNGRLYSL